VSIFLRIILLIGAVFATIYMLRSVKRSRMRIEDTLFWVFLTLLILVIAIFPQIITFFAGVLGVASEQNLLFLLFLFILLVVGYGNAKANSEQETQLRELTQQIALDRLDHYERTHGEKDE